MRQDSAFSRDRLDLLIGRLGQFKWLGAPQRARLDFFAESSDERWYLFAAFLIDEE